MKKKVLALILLLCGIFANVSGQQKINKDLSMTNTVHQLNPVVVTGNGHHEYLKSSTTPVHVMTSQDIHQQGVTHSVMHLPT